MSEVYVIGVGVSGARPNTADISYKELMFQTALKAYHDAGIDPRKDVDSFVTVAEDLNEGTCIFDEYVPDQLGAAQKPNHTIGGEGIHGFAAACMQIMTGHFDVVVLEAHSKASNITDPESLLHFATDPIWYRPLQAPPVALAGLEMQRFLKDTKNTAKQCALVVEKNKHNALNNPYAAYSSNISANDVLAGESIAEPLKHDEVAPLADACVVLVLVSAKKLKKFKGPRKNRKAVKVQGLGWSNELYSLERRDWAHATYAQQAAWRAYKMAGIRKPEQQIHVAEIDDQFAYKELQHMQALGLTGKRTAGSMLEKGHTLADGKLPVNVSGGSLGVGFLLEASGVMRLAEIVLQLRGEAGAKQVKKARTGLAFGWRGLPTTSAAAAILSGVN